MVPYANTHTTQCHLDEISHQIAPDAQGAALMDSAGSLISNDLQGHKKPGHHPVAIQIARTQPDQRHLAAQRQNWHSNRILEDQEVSTETGCKTRNKLINRPALIQSIGMKKQIGHYTPLLV